MSFSDEWNNIYGANQNIISWPWSDVVSLSHKYCKHFFHKKAAILEVGCGTGANISFFNAKDFKYHGIDGSPKIISSLKQKYPELKNALLCDDFTKKINFNTQFDMVIDRAAITHNDTSSIKESLSNIRSKLNTNGMLLAIDWFSTSHGDSQKGLSVDSHTRTSIPTGQFKGVGKVHFSDKDHLLEIFSEFEILLMREKVVTNSIPDSTIFAAWDIVAIKR